LLGREALIPALILAYCSRAATVSLADTRSFEDQFAGCTDFVGKQRSFASARPPSHGFERSRGFIFNAWASDAGFGESNHREFYRRWAELMTDG